MQGSAGKPRARGLRRLGPGAAREGSGRNSNESDSPGLAARPVPLPGGQGRRHSWPQPAAPSPSGVPEGPQARRVRGLAPSQAGQSAARALRADRSGQTAQGEPEGGAAAPARPAASGAKQKPNAEKTGRSPARPCWPPSRPADRAGTAAPFPDPSAAPAARDQSPPPTAGPPSPARLPALLGHGRSTPRECSPR